MATAPPLFRPGWIPQRTGRHRDHDKRRGSSTQRGYGYRWQQIRKRVLAEEPLCRFCRDRGRVTAAQEVDHVLPLADGGTHDRDNLRPLCKSCHSTHTGRSKGAGQISED